MKPLYIIATFFLVATHSYAQTDTATKVFAYVENMPEFPGGTKELMKFLQRHIQYPKEAIDNNIQGKVLTRFVVMEDGSVTDVQVVRSVDHSLDSEAVRVVRLLPKFSQGTQQGKPVRVYFNLPVSFKLTTPDNSEKKLIEEKLAKDPYYKGAIDSAKQGLYQQSIYLSTLSVLMFPNEYLGYELLAHFDSLLNLRGPECDNYAKAQELGSPTSRKCILDSLRALDSANHVFTFVERNPQFPGGDAELMKFLSKNIQYPKYEREHGIEGKVLLRIIIDVDGSVKDVKVVRSISTNLNDEAVRVVKLLPKFTPGYHLGVPVKVYFNLPVIFRLSNFDSNEKKSVHEKTLLDQYYQGAIILIQQNHYEDAAKTLGYAILKFPDGYLNYEFLAICYIKMSKLKEACEAYQKAKEHGSPYASTFLINCK